MEPAISASSSRAAMKQIRSVAFSEIMLDMQRHIVLIEDRDAQQKHRYEIETVFRTREGYCYSVKWKPLWESVEQVICTGSRFETADLAVSSALTKIEAWERWLEVSTNDPESEEPKPR